LGIIGEFIVRWSGWITAVVRFVEAPKIFYKFFIKLSAYENMKVLKIGRKLKKEMRKILQNIFNLIARTD